MNEHQLSKRLTEVASLVPPGSRLADIGTDHAYLPIHLLIQGKICTAVAGDINEGPYQLAQTQIEKLGLSSVVEVRKGDGLEVIDEGEVDVISIAGMGGSLICQILNNGIEKLARVKRLILQPNMAGHLIRHWCLVHGWEIKKETMIEEDGKYYEIIMVEHGDAESPYAGLSATEKERALLMGPLLLQEQSPAFMGKWAHELEKRRKILSSLQQTDGEEKEEKEQKVLAEISIIEKGVS
jgi:tRNA (adenine22-N1)-methyltransferase